MRGCVLVVASPSDQTQILPHTTYHIPPFLGRTFIIEWYHLLILLPCEVACCPPLSSVVPVCPSEATQHALFRTRTHTADRARHSLTEAPSTPSPRTPRLDRSPVRTRQKRHRPPTNATATQRAVCACPCAARDPPISHALPLYRSHDCQLARTARTAPPLNRKPCR